MLRLVPALLLVVAASSDVLDNDVLPAEEPRENANATLPEIFARAVEAYLDEDWDGCIVEFNEALRRYKEHRRTTVKCRRTCRDQASDTTLLFPENIEDLHFYERKVKETLCLLKCNEDYRKIKGRASLKLLPQHVEAKFAERRPYEYLHICYYQRNRFQDAANAVFTFLVVHPKHEMSVKNLRYYTSLKEVSEAEIRNLEVDPFLEVYINGVIAYDAEHYEEAAALLESSLRMYMESEEQCRFYCEGPFDQGWNPEFTSSMTNHFVYCLKCKRECSMRLNNLNGDYRRDLLPSHYNYLQFAYYKLGKLRQAAAAVESYLLFFPADETMRQNKEYYAAMPKVTEEDFTPTKEALDYVKRQEYELALLYYITQEFSVLERKPEKKKPDGERSSDPKAAGKEMAKLDATRTPPIPPPGRSPASQFPPISEASTILAAEELKRRRSRAVRQLKTTTGVRVIAGEKELGGRLRYLADGFLNTTECDSLLQLAQIGGVEGDGYEENRSPHSRHERFEGVTLGRAALLVYFGLMEPELLELFLRATETGRDHVERYFGLDRQLYFTYTHLVCRSALPGSPPQRRDLSHEVHADNCLVGDDGSCARVSPAYTWRDYSAILYLNDDFEGGELVFAEDKFARKIQGAVRPKCGRMVAFSAGKENLHGVRGVLRGRRCALALWFTHEEEHLETERILARAVLRRVRAGGFDAATYDDVDIPVRYENLLIERFREDEALMHLLED